MKKERRAYHDGERSSIHDDVENNTQDANKHRSLFSCMQKIQRAEDHQRHEYHLDYHSYCDLFLYIYIITTSLIKNYLELHISSNKST